MECMMLWVFVSCMQEVSVDHRGTCGVHDVVGVFVLHE